MGKAFFLLALLGLATTLAIGALEAAGRLSSAVERIVTVNHIIETREDRIDDIRFSDNREGDTLDPSGLTVWEWIPDEAPAQ